MTQRGAVKRHDGSDERRVRGVHRSSGHAVRQESFQEKKTALVSIADDVAIERRLVCSPPRPLRFVEGHGRGEMPVDAP